jgi:gamma-glutamyltranspeptidase / glutathione hydrolase
MSFFVRAAAFVAVLLVILGAGPSLSTQGSQGAVMDRSMVVSAHPLATEVGVSIMREGGNAIDAAIAVHFALAVVSPWAGNIGGGGFMLARTSDGHVHALDFREKASASATSDMYLDSTGAVIPKLSTRGALAAGVPGTVAGLLAMHDSLGSMPIERLIQPAIDLARNGVVLSRYETFQLNAARNDLERYSTMPCSYTERDRWHVGDTIFQPELAETLTRIREEGRAGFYGGRTADLIVDEMRRNHGLVTHDDLLAYHPMWREPIKSRFRGLDVYGMPPPSSGGVAVAQLLSAMEAAPEYSGGWNCANRVHYMVEAIRRVYADRAMRLGDPDFLDIPLSELVDPEYILSKMDDMDSLQATPSALLFDRPAPLEHDQTTHFSIVDPMGNAVSITTTLNGNFGSCVVVGGAGFVLNNEMDDFSLNPGKKNRYGVKEGNNNAIAPNKRMLSSMAPTIVTKDGALFMVLGTPGGASIITTVFQTLLNVVDHGMSMQEAVSAPRFHHQWLPDTIQAESGCFSSKDSILLVRMGHNIRTRPPYGRVDAIRVLSDGRLEGGADPRGEGLAGGF